VRIEAGAVPPGGFRTSAGRWLTRGDPAALQQRTGAALAPVTRAELHEALLRTLPDGVVQLGVEVTDVPDVDLAVAADGIDSRLRARLSSDHCRPSQFALRDHAAPRIARTPPCGSPYVLADVRSAARKPKLREL
jgi:hypothetical protein